MTRGTRKSPHATGTPTQFPMIPHDVFVTNVNTLRTIGICSTKIKTMNPKRASFA